MAFRTPDGRDVLIRRGGDHWFVRCGHSQSRSENLDVALARAIRADTDVVGHASEIDYAAWVRQMANKLAPQSIPLADEP